MSQLKARLDSLYERIHRTAGRAGRRADEITLVAVTKTVEPPVIEAAFKAGIRNFGENRVQEAESKIKLTHLHPKPSWHMIGHVQSNKVNTALELFDIIQSVDSIALAELSTAGVRSPKSLSGLCPASVGMTIAW